MRVGTNYQVINPPMGCQMEGYESRFATGQHDDLTASVIYLEDTPQQILLIALDLVAIPAYRVDRLKRLIVEKTTVQAKSIIIAAVHSHSGPTVTDLLLDMPQIDESYWHQITLKVIQSVQLAIEHTQIGHAKLRSSQIPTGIYANRNQIDAPYNGQLLRLVVFDDQNRLFASLLLLGSHPTVMNADNTLLSADLVAAIRSRYQSIFGIRPVIMLTDCGDTSTRFTRRESTFSETTRLGNQIVNALKKDDWQLPISISHLQIKNIEMACDYDPITNSQADVLWHQINQQVKTATNDHRTSLTGFLNTYTHIRYYGHTHFKTTAWLFETPDFRIVTYPGELVNALGTRIRNADNKPTVLITLANDYRGYSVNQEVFGQYFESYNSVLLAGMADQFVDDIVAVEKAK